MKSLIQYFVKHEVLVNLIILLIVGTGILALFNMQSTLFPRQDAEFVVV